MKRKILSFVLVICTVLALIPLNAFQTINAKAATSKKITEYSVGETLYFGSYPQSKVTDNSIIKALNELAGVKSNVASSTADWTSYEYYPPLSNTKSNFMRYKDITYGADKYRGVVFDSNRLYCNASNKDAVSAGLFDSQPENGYTKGNVY